MAKRQRNTKQDKRDIIEQGIISSKSLSAFLRITSRDKRTKKSTQSEAKKLFSNLRDKEVGEALGISRQRATSLKKQIQQGRAYSPELRDILRATRDEYVSTPQRMENGVTFFPDQRRLERTTRVEVIKRFGFLEDALDWWENIIGSDTYIAISKSGNFYNVVGLGYRKERPKAYTTKNKSGVKRTVRKIEEPGENRVSQIMRKYIK